MAQDGKGRVKKAKPRGRKKAVARRGSSTKSPRKGHGSRRRPNPSELRLTRELRESLQHQAAIAEVLQVISNSPGELEAVFEAVLKNATRICDARFGTLLRFDGNAFYFAADIGTPPALAEFARRPGPFRGSPGGMVDRIQSTDRCSTLPIMPAIPHQVLPPNWAEQDRRSACQFSRMMFW